MKKLGICLILMWVLADSTAAQPRAGQDRPRLHILFYPDYQKDVRNYALLSRQLTKLDQAAALDKSSLKDLKKQAKDLEKITGHILSYLLDGGPGPGGLPLDADARTPKQKLDLLIPLLAPVEQGMSDIQPKPVLIAAPERSTLLIQLQTIKRISHELGK